MEVEKGSIQHDPGGGSSSAWPANLDGGFIWEELKNETAIKRLACWRNGLATHPRAIREPTITHSVVQTRIEASSQPSVSTSVG